MNTFNYINNQSLKCKIEGKKIGLALTLTGMCVAISPVKEVLHFQVQAIPHTFILNNFILHSLYLIPYTHINIIIIIIRLVPRNKHR